VRLHTDSSGDVRLLTIRVQRLESELTRARQRCQEAEHEAAIARKASEDAWQFARLMQRAPSRTRAGAEPPHKNETI
jgi:hypothetical protein